MVTNILEMHTASICPTDEGSVGLQNVYETAWSDILPSQDSMHINCFSASTVMLLPITVHNSTILGSYSKVLTSWRE